MMSLIDQPTEELEKKATFLEQHFRTVVEVLFAGVISYMFTMYVKVNNAYLDYVTTKGTEQTSIITENTEAKKLEIQTLEKNNSVLIEIKELLKMSVNK